jgi:hypothetical protein
MTQTDIGQQFFDAIVGPLTNLGFDLKNKASEVKMYAAQSMARLATLVGQPGYEMAVEAERDIVAIKVGMKVLADAKKTDAVAVGIIEGALRMGAGLLGGPSA